MKKFISIIILFAVSILGYAQTKEGESVVSLDAGYSIVGNLIASSLDLSSSDFNASITPVLMFSFDHGLTDNFSIGLFAGYQALNVEFPNTYFDENDIEQNEIVNAEVSRLNVAVKPMFHYGSSDRLDMYSGLRVGYRVLSAKHDSNAPVYNDLNAWDRSGFSFGLTAFGFRYYVTDNFGFNMEVSIGMPYAAGVGINYRL